MIKSARRIEQVEEYYFSKKLQEVRSLDSDKQKVINLGIGSPDLPPSKSVVAALSNTAEKENSHGYQSYKGTPSLRNAIANFNRRTYNISLDPEKEILPLMGSKEGIMHVSMAFVDDGDIVLIPDPGYPTYSSVSNLVGAAVKTYKLNDDDWSISFDALEAIDLSRVKIMWVNYPHMPTGKRASRSELQRLVNLARKHQFLIVNDNPYSLILNEDPFSILSLDGAADVAIELNSLSKSHNMAGWRIGWAAGHQGFIEKILRVKSNMDSGMFLGLQEAAVAALSQGPAWFDQLNAIYRQRQKKAFELLDLLNCSYSGNQSGLFVWARVPEQIASVEKWIDEILYGTRIFLTPGFIFGSAGDRYVRISLCATEEKMQEAIDRLRVFVTGNTLETI